MKIEKLGDNITEIDGKVRVELGHVRRKEIATEELLSNDVTAAHYGVGLKDSLGNVIALGKPMDFIDWLSPDRHFYVYQLQEVTDMVDEKPVKNMRWLPVGEPAVFDDEAAALSRATTIAAELAA
jgi:hypothetical protein